VQLKVRDGRLSYWLNNHKVYEEEVSGPSPWLHFNTDSPRQAAFRNLKLTGEPVVPEQIELISNNRMEGWNTSYFSESQPKHRVMAQTVTERSDYTLRQQHESEPA